ncbi:MAG: hypothetical protein GY854_19935 [Deltaproteobacteria bacterium]|nr:hypothetical protein [Deltaproteobacteria bacterium]
MKVRISYTVDLDNDARRAIANQWPCNGPLASRNEIKSMYEALADADVETIIYDGRQQFEEEKERQDKN